MAKNIILGTVQFGLPYGINNAKGKPGTGTINEILEEAGRCGIKILDTANAYGNAQEQIGNFHRSHAIRFIVNTKFNGVNIESIGDQLNRSLALLEIDSVNTYFYHSFKDYASGPGLLHALTELKNEKRIHKIGVSVYTNEELAVVINDPAVDVIQMPFNLLDNTSQRGALLVRAKQAGKTIQARSVFLQGLFFKEVDTLPVKVLPLCPYLQKLHALAAETGSSMELLCLQYVNAQDHIDEIIIGVDTKEQLVSNFIALNTPIDREVLQVINEIQVSETELLYPYNWT